MGFDVSAMLAKASKAKTANVVAPKAKSFAIKTYLATEAKNDAGLRVDTYQTITIEWLEALCKEFQTDPLIVRKRILAGLPLSGLVSKKFTEKYEKDNPGKTVDVESLRELQACEIVGDNTELAVYWDSQVDKNPE